jgi:pimeloyl-ACP methyl ester carboxylesterase
MSALATIRKSTSRSMLLAFAVAIAAFCAAVVTAPVTAEAATTKPTVVLVHGAFADASGWAGVTERLQQRGYAVLAPPNPLRGLASDTTYLKDVLARVKGPIVLVGHSYGGMVISNAATGDPDVKALVYVAAFAPDEGDSVSSLSAVAPGGMVGPSTLDFAPFTAPDGTQQPEATIKQSVFRSVFAADLPKRVTDFMAVSQRPAAAATLTDPSGPPAWRSIRSYYLVAGQDKAIGAANERIMAKHIGATTVELKGASHVPMISQPGPTTELILRAAGAKTPSR